MPLKKGKSQKAFSQNIRELMHAYMKKGKIGTSTPSSKEEARQQALAIAYDVARKRA